MSDPAQLLVDHLDIWTGAIERKSGSGRGRKKAGGNGGKISLYGIDKLRSLILDLAVRGKLVPQDPAEGDAGELLKRASQAISEAVARKQMRTPKAQKFEPPEAELPQGWVWARLIDIAQINPRNETDDDIDASFVPMPLVSDRVDGAHETETRRWGDIRSGYTHFADGDIALAKITPCFENGKAALFVGLENGIGAGTTELHVARPVLPDFDRRYLLLTLKTPRYLAEGEAGMTGTAGQKRVPRGYFELTPFPLPPLAEQGRIVAKVDELMALVDALEAGTRAGMEAHETLVRELLATLVNSQDADDLAQNWSRIEAHFDTLFTTEDSIEALKQTVLELAVRGKLTALLRTTNPIDLRIAIEREKKAKVSKGSHKQRKEQLSFSGLDELKAAYSEQVCKVQLDEIADIVRGGSPRPAGDPRFYDGEIPFLKVADVTRNSGKKVEGYEYTIKTAGLRKTRFVEDRIVLLTNSGATLGIPAILEFPAAFNDGIAAFQSLSSYILEEYLYLCLNSLTSWFLTIAARGQGQPNLNTDIIRAAWISVPSKEDQRCIVDFVDTVWEICDGTKHSIRMGTDHAAVLANVFAR